MNIFGHHRTRHKQPENIEPITTTHNLEDIGKEDESINCTSGKKENQRYSSSFVGNTTNGELNVDKDFDEVIGNNSKTKKTSSVHVGEDITLCWIETTTIKENKTVRPPKRLVIREYTISFENSATIPDRYLECKRLEDELAMDDPKIDKTALFEVIDENTKVSRIVNFTAVSHVGDVIVWQHKRVKCGVGPVVSKNIIEWKDGSENPKKRVEIKVSPKMHPLTATKSEEEPCTEEIKEDSTEYESTSNENNFTESCENGACEITAESSESLEPYEGSTSAETESDDLSISVTESSTSSREEVFVESTTTINTLFPISEKNKSVISKKDIEGCEKDSSDPACIMQETATPITEESSNEFSIPTTTNAKVTSKIPILTTSMDMINEKEISSEENVSITESLFSSSKEEQASVDSSLTQESVEDQHMIRPVESTNKDLDKIDNILDISTITSEIIFEEQVTTATPLFKVTEFTKEANKSGNILNLSEQPSIAADNIESLLTFEEISSENTEGTELAMGETVGLEENTTVREFIPTFSMTTSPPKIESTTSSPAISSKVDDSCENSEDCAYVSSSETDESCDESGNCESSESCEPGECSDEEIDNSISETTTPSTMTEIQLPMTKLQSSGMQVATEILHTTPASAATTTLTSREAENSSTAINNISTTVETRRSTVVSMTTIKPRHKLTLKIKVLVEHVDDKKEKQNLVEVEKYLTLDENPQYHGHSDLLEQLKSLNSSINMETISALLNCTSLGKLAKDVELISQQSNNTIDDNLEESEFTHPSMSHRLNSGHIDDKYEDSQYSESSQEHELASQRRRRRSLDANGQNLFDLNDPLALDSSIISTKHRINNAIKKNIPFSVTINDPEKETSNAVYVENERHTSEGTNKNETFSTIKKEKMEAVRQSLSGIQKDVLTGLRHVVSQMEQENLTSTDDSKKVVKKNLLNIIADPKDDRIHSRKRRAAAEEVGHWSNERVSKAPMGGNFRSITEFTLYKESLFE